MDFETLALAKKYADKQRLGYTEKKEELVFSGVKVDEYFWGNSDFLVEILNEEQMNGFTLVFGENYRVRIGSNTYDAQCRSEALPNGDCLAIGNLSMFSSITPGTNFPDTGEDFCVMMAESNNTKQLIIFSKYEGDCSISVIKDVYYTIDNRYIDFLNGGKVVIPPTTLTTSENEPDIAGINIPITEPIFKEDRIYRVKLGDDIYSVRCKRVEDLLLIGNTAIISGDNDENTGEHFIIGQSDTYVMIMDLMKRSSVSIVEQETIKPEYLHFLEEKNKTILPNTPMAPSEGYPGSLYMVEEKAFDLVIGQTYKVMLDSGTFQCKGVEISVGNARGVALGNLHMANVDFFDTGESFVVAVIEDISIGECKTLIMDTKFSSHVSIILKQELVQPKYLPPYGGFPIVELTTRLPIENPSTSIELTTDEQDALSKAVSQSQYFILSATVTIEGVDALTISGLTTKVVEASGALSYIVPMMLSYATLSIGVSRSGSSQTWSGVFNMMGSID